jgi:hypothetical protein
MKQYVFSISARRRPTPRRAREGDGKRARGRRGDTRRWHLGVHGRATRAEHGDRAQSSRTAMPMIDGHCPPRPNSSWCRRPHSSTRQARPMSPRHWQTCLTSCAPPWKLKPSFAASRTRDRRGVALRLGSVYGPEAASARPTDRYNVHLHTHDVHTHDAGRALLAALSCLAASTTSAMTPTRSVMTASPKRLVGDPGKLHSPAMPSADLLDRLLLQGQAAAALPTRMRG